MILRYAIAPSCQSTLLSALASSVMTTLALGSSLVYAGKTIPLCAFSHCHSELWIST